VGAPCTRLEIEAVRGVDGEAVLATLSDRRLVRILGRKEAPGRPLLYGTTREFLEVFGLPDLTALPTLRELGEGAEMLAAADVTIGETAVAAPDEAPPSGEETAPAEGDG
jgi:segregation and condensation protein B